MAKLLTVGITVTVTCRVFKLSSQPCHRPLAALLTPGEAVKAYRAKALFDAHQNDPVFGHRPLADQARDAGGKVGFVPHSGSHHRSHDSARSGSAIEVGGAAGLPVHDALCTVVDEHGQIRHVFAADAPNELELPRVSEHKTAERRLYLGEAKDIQSNRIVGSPLDSRMKSKTGPKLSRTLSLCTST